MHQLHVLEPLAVEGVDLGEEGVGERVGALPHLGHLRLANLALRLHPLELFPLPHRALQRGKFIYSSDWRKWITGFYSVI